MEYDTATKRFLLDSQDNNQLGVENKFIPLSDIDFIIGSADRIKNDAESMRKQILARNADPDALSGLFVAGLLEEYSNQLFQVTALACSDIEISDDEIGRLLS